MGMGILFLFGLLGIGVLQAQDPSASLFPAPTQLPRARVTLRYNVTFSPNPPQAYKWSVTGPVPGLEFGGNEYVRTLSGTPTQAGSFPFTIRFERACAANSAPGCVNVNHAVTYTLQAGGSPAIANTTLPDARIGVDYFAILESSGTNGSIAWSAVGLPPGITLRQDARSGAVLSGRPTRGGIYSVGLRLRDGTGESASRTLTIAVTASTSTSPSAPSGGPEVTTGAILPEASTGTLYDLTLEARGGQPPHRFAARGALPPGLAMNELGRIAGTPQRHGTFLFDVVTTDAAGLASPPKTFLLDVFSSLHIQTTDLPAGVEQRDYAYRLRAAGGVKPYEWTALGLPAGMQLTPAANDPSSADLTGRPAGPTAGTGSLITITVRDRSGLSDRRNYRLLISDSTLRVLTTSLPEGRVGRFYSQTFQIGGGRPPYTCSSIGPAPPTDLRLSATGCVLSGLARYPSNFTFNLQVRDAAGATVTANLPFNIITPEIRIVNRPLPKATEGAPLAPFQLEGEGGSGQYLFRATGLPGGLRLSPEGLLSGTAQAAGIVETVNITITDRGRPDDSYSQLYTMEVRPRGSVTILSAGNLGSALLDQPFRLSLDVTGGRPPYRWTTTSAAPAQPVPPLPPGIFLDPDTGTLTGRAFQPGTYRFLIRAADIDGQNDVREFDLSVDLPLEVRVAEQPEFLLAGETGRVQLAATASDPTRIEYSLTTESPDIDIDRRTGLITVRASAPGVLAIEAAATDGRQTTPVHIAIRVIDALPGRLSILPFDTVSELPADTPRALLPVFYAGLSGGRPADSAGSNVTLALATAPAGAEPPRLTSGGRATDGSVADGSVRWSQIPLEGTGPFSQNLLGFSNVPARPQAGLLRQNLDLRLSIDAASAAASVPAAVRNGVEVAASRTALVIQEKIKDAFRHATSLIMTLQSTSGEIPGITLTPRDAEQVRVTLAADPPGTFIFQVLRHDPAQMDRIELDLAIADTTGQPAVVIAEAGFLDSGVRGRFVLATPNLPNPALFREPARNRYGVPVAPGALGVIEFLQPPGLEDATITSDSPVEELGGLRVRIADAQGNAHTAGLLSVSSSQVLFQVPQTAAGLATAAIESTADQATVAQGALLVSPVAPALISADGSGAGPARGHSIRAGESTVLAYFDDSAGIWRHVPFDAPAPGQSIQIRLDAAGLRNRTDLSRVQALAGVQSLTIVSAGPHPEIPYLDSVVLEVPSALRSAGAVEVRLSVDGIETNAVTIEVR